MSQSRKATPKATTKKAAVPATTSALTTTKPAAAQPQPVASGPAGKNGPTPVVQVTLNHEQIAQRAFAIWVAKGKPQGQDTQNWSDAENQLRQELARRA